jgi:hypothetical protein
MDKPEKDTSVIIWLIPRVIALGATLFLLTKIDSLVGPYSRMILSHAHAGTSGGVAPVRWTLDVLILLLLLHILKLMRRWGPSSKLLDGVARLFGMVPVMGSIDKFISSMMNAQDADGDTQYEQKEPGRVSLWAHRALLRFPAARGFVLRFTDKSSKSTGHTVTGIVVRTQYNGQFVYGIAHTETLVDGILCLNISSHGNPPGGWALPEVPADQVRVVPGMRPHQIFLRGMTLGKFAPASVETLPYVPGSLPRGLVQIPSSGSRV